MPRVDTVLQSRPRTRPDAEARSKRASLLLRILPLAAAVLFGFVLVLGSGVPAQTAAAVGVSAVEQCNGLDNQGGRAVDCTVTVTNHYDVATDTGSSTIDTKACSGFANAPLGYLCTTDLSTFSHLTTTITQCNGSGSGGLGTVTCTAHIINLVTGGSEGMTAATVNACIDSGTGGGADSLLCDPIDSTTDATITQCNGSGNGGGSTARVKCSVTPSTITSEMPTVTINQCVGSGNGGGGFVTCTASIVTTLLPADEDEGDTTGTTTTGTTTPGTTTPGTTTAGTTTPAAPAGTTTTSTAGTTGTTSGTVTSGTVTGEATTPGTTTAGTTTAGTTTAGTTTAGTTTAGTTTGTTTRGTTTSGTTGSGAHPNNLASTGLDPVPAITLGVIAGVLGGFVLFTLRRRQRTR